MNTITINFIPCTPAPVNGYNVKWRVAGSLDPYTDEGNFPASPAVFVDSINPEGTCYEGFLTADCTESGMSGTLLGNPIAWATVCPEISGATNYQLSLLYPCNGAQSGLQITGGQAGDIVTVRASFSGQMTRIGGNFVRANLQIFAPDGTVGNVSSACYEDSVPHGFSITADTVITMPGSTENVVVIAVVDNSSESLTSCVVTIIDINGTPHNIFVVACRGNSATGGNC